MNDYYMWLLGKVDALHGPYNCFSRLLQYLFSTEYTYAFVMDANRAKGGEALRSIYALDQGLFLDNVYQGPCTVLEMLIAIADYLAFNMDTDTSKWFWELIENLGLGFMDDTCYDENYISQRLSSWMNRSYGYDGQGSLFPLKNPTSDTRTMEIWDQMNAYILENYPVGNWID